MKNILVVNAGSSSIKFALFGPDFDVRMQGVADGIGGASRLKLGHRSEAMPLPDHEAAQSAILAALEQEGVSAATLSAVGHRVVHGGPHLTAPARITPEVESLIAYCNSLAPLHNPVALMVIRAFQQRAPELPQVAVFDTAFHACNPEVARRYAIPQDYHDRGFRRYGFHGISYASVVDSFGADLPERLLACHLGNGASLCAIHNGKSVATTMGYSPLDGLTMGTRCGALDPAVVLRLAKSLGIDQTDALLNGESGLIALAGANDMAALLARDDPDATFAVEHFCYWAARHAGSMVVAMGGADAVAFTGGIGENAPDIRAKIMSHLAFLGDLPVNVVPAQEELKIARDVSDVLMR